MLRSHSADSITERAVEAYAQIEDPRLREVMAALIRHLHTLVKELSFTHISLLTEVLTAINLAAIFHNNVHLFELSTEPNKNTIIV